MRCLYTVNSHLKESPNVFRDKVYYAESLEDAQSKFLANSYYREHHEIDSIVEVKTNNCMVLYQIFKDILSAEEHTYQLWEDGEDWYITVPLYKGKNPIRFDSIYVHGADNDLDGLTVMVCAANGCPNWIYI